jgi:DNA-binding GntR family transcriptional regulator
MRASARRADAHGQALQNSEFHTHVIAASGNRTIQRLWSLLEPFARTYLTATAPGADLHWLAERHVAILDALEAHDPDRAAQAMRVHAREAEQQFRKAR